MKREFDAFYRDKAVFVTGHTGFKGAWLTAWLHNLGARVIGYALPPEENSLFSVAGLSKRITHIEGDIRDQELLTRAMSDHKPQIVFHLAAQALVRPSYRLPRETFDVNVMGTVTLLDAVRATPSVRVCQIVTSDKCYDNREWVYAYRENDPMGGHDPYSASKGAAELAVRSYRDSFFSTAGSQAIASVRAGNVIGGGDWSVDRIVPDCIRALSSGARPQIRSPNAIRPWQHVLEPLGGYLSLGQAMWRSPEKYSDAWNFGPMSAGNVSVRNIVELVVNEWGSGGWDDVSVSHNASLHEATFLKLDCTKANTLLRWRPIYSVEESVTQTVEWYRHHHVAGKSFPAYEFTVSQIESYMAKAEKRK